MVSPIEPRRTLQDFLKEQAESLARKTVMFRWYVIEHTPGYNNGGYYDQDVPPKNVKVSDTFDTVAEAEEWISRHNPDPGNELHIRRIRLIRETVERWVEY